MSRSPQDSGTRKSTAENGGLNVDLGTDWDRNRERRRLWKILGIHRFLRTFSVYVRVLAYSGETPRGFSAVFHIFFRDFDPLLLDSSVTGESPNPQSMMMTANFLPFLLSIIPLFISFWHVADSFAFAVIWVLMGLLLLARSAISTWDRFWWRDRTPNTTAEKMAEWWGPAGYVDVGRGLCLFSYCIVLLVWALFFVFAALSWLSFALIRLCRSKKVNK